MKRRFVNPFCPNRPIDDPLKFAGRKDQIEEIIDALFQTAHNNPSHIIITGDRGIGKSSLLLQTKLLATGDNRLPEKLEIDTGMEREFRFVTAWHDTESKETVEKFASGILRNLQSELHSALAGLKIELNIANIISISQKEKEESLSDLVNEFCKQISSVDANVHKQGKDGILLFIDEIDKVDVSSGVATFLKLSVEKLNRDGVKNVAFVCAGITGAVQRLEEEHASILRTLQEIPIDRLSREETKTILESGFSAVDVSTDDQVFDLVYSKTNGFPEPVHLLGSEMLKVDNDDYLDETDFQDAMRRLVTELRKNELKDVLAKAGYGKYQRILLAMAQCDSPNVSLSFISQFIGEAQNEYSTNINKLIERQIITRVDKGVYSFIDPLLKEYIKNFGIISASGDDENE